MASPLSPKRRRPRSWPAALVGGAVLAVAITATAPGFAASGTSAPGPDLGLPSIAAASKYNLAPASRTVLPAQVSDSSGTDIDFVTAATPGSETPAHDLQAGPGSATANLDGTTVRQAGPDTPGAEFGYRMQAPSGGGSVRLRIEEAGSATSHYQVLVNGTVVHERRPDAAQSGTWHDLVGLVHYDVPVPRQLIGSGRDFRVTFRNAVDPGPGARIANLSVLADGGPGTTQAPYGGSVTDPAAAFRGGTTSLRSDIHGRPYVVYDFGQEVGGKVELTADATSGSPVLNLAFSESAQFLTTASDFSQDPPGVATETHAFPLERGRQTVTDPVIRGGFRYLMVYLSAPGAVDLSGLQLHFTADPANPDLRGYKGAFLSSDDTLNRLWYAGAYTVQMSTIDPRTGRPYPAQPGPVRNDAVIGDGDTVISDGAKRDRMIWGGDNAVSDPVSYLTTGQSAPAANAISFMAKGQFASGQIPGVYLPGSGYNSGWGEYAAWWIQNLWTHYLYTGDRSFLDAHWPALQKDVAWFETLVGSDGLLNVPGGASGHWGYGNTGEEAYDNALYVHVLNLAAQAAQAQGDDALAGKYRAAATRTTDAINAKLWDASAGAYVEMPDSSAHPQDANAMAVVAGVATGDRAASVLAFFHDKLSGAYGDLTNDVSGDTVPRYISPFVTAQSLQAYADRHSKAADDAALDLLGRTWNHMLDGAAPGTFWENVSPSGGLQLGSYTSLSHGWAAAPTSFLTNEVLGVTPTSGGFETFDALPHPGGHLRWAEGTVPTPHGDVRAAWKLGAHSFELQVTAPSGTSGTAGVPAAGVTGLRVDGQLVWQDGKALRPGVELHDGYLRITGVTGTTTLQTTTG